MRRHTLGLVLAGALSSAGCAVRPAPSPAASGQERPAAPAAHAGSWEVVLPGARVSAGPGAESARLDGALALRRPETIIDQRRWPPAQGPSLDNLRGRFVSDDPRVVNYYSDLSHPYSWWYGGWTWR